MLFVTNLTWTSFTSQKSKTQALFRQCFATLYVVIHNLKVSFNWDSIEFNIELIAVVVDVVYCIADYIYFTFH